MDGTHKSEAVIDQVFLTPRVLDARAFNEYSATLQELLKEASGHQENLQSVSTEVKTLRQGVQDATTELQRRLDVAVKVLPGIDQKLAKAEKLASDANRALTIDPSEKLAAMQAAASKIIADAIADLQTRLTDVFSSSSDQARRHADELIARSSELEKTALSIASSFEANLVAKADEISRLATESNGIFDTQARLYDDRLSRRGEELEVRMRTHAIAAERTIEDKLNAIESKMMRFEQMLGETAERQANAAVASVISRAEEVERRAQTLITDATAQLEAAALAASKITHCVNSLIETHAPRLENAQMQADGAADRLGALLATARDFIESDQGGGAIREIRAIAARLESVRADSDFASRQFDEIRKQADLARRNLGEALLEAAAGADQILSKSEQVLERTQQCERMAQSLIEQNMRLEAAAQTVEVTATRVDEFDATSTRIAAELEGLEQKKALIETSLRHTGELLDMADITLAERYNKLGAAIQQGVQLNDILAATTTECIQKLDAARQEELEIARQYAAATEQIRASIGGDLPVLLAQSQAASIRLAALVKQAEESSRNNVQKSQPTAVSASTLFPTAR